MQIFAFSWVHFCIFLVRFLFHPFELTFLFPACVRNFWTFSKFKWAITVKRRTPYWLHNKAVSLHHTVRRSKIYIFVLFCFVSLIVLQFNLWTTIKKWILIVKFIVKSISLTSRCSTPINFYYKRMCVCSYSGDFINRFSFSKFIQISMQFVDLNFASISHWQINYF